MRAKAIVLWTLVVLFVVAMLSFMVTYSVRFTEAAVVTTFGKAAEGTEAKKPGLHFKLPYPFQSVTKYDTRLQIVKTRGETQQTSDDKTIIVEAYCLWRVSDPLKFFTRFGNAGDRAEEHFGQAEDQLRGRLRGALTLTGRYELSDLFGKDGSKLPELERAMMTRLQGGDGDTAPGEAQANASLDGLGIEVVEVGISRVLLANEITERVIERMIANRNRLVREIESRGQAEAESIRSNAEANAQRIIAFAEQRANEIMAKGDREAAQYIAAMKDNPELAIFLKNLDMMRNALAKQTTLVFATDTPGFGLIEPTALDGLGDREVPVDNLVERLGGGREPVAAGSGGQR